MIAYRLLFIGGPSDGDTMVVGNPWNSSWPNNWLYKAELEDDGQPVMEDGDSGDGVVEAITQDGAFTPPMKTIRLYWTGKKKMSDAEWEIEKAKYE